MLFECSSNPCLAHSPDGIGKCSSERLIGTELLGKDLPNCEELIEGIVRARDCGQALGKRIDNSGSRARLSLDEQDPCRHRNCEALERTTACKRVEDSIE